MARLLLEGILKQRQGLFGLIVDVSVSRADDGKPVTGLTHSNFRFAQTFGAGWDFVVSSVTEWKWVPGDKTDLAGCYEVSIEGKNQVLPDCLGIQVRTFSRARSPVFTQLAVDEGQTIVSLLPPR